MSYAYPNDYGRDYEDPDDGYDDEPACDCIDYEVDWEGRATCGQCGNTWWPTAEELKRDRERRIAAERALRWMEFRDRWFGWLDPLRWRCARLWRRNKPMRASIVDDDIPF